MNITEDQLKAMQARVKGGGVPAEQVTAVRPILPAKFTIIGHAVSINAYHIPVIQGGKPAKVKSAEARAWDALMAEQLLQQWGIMGAVSCEVFLIVDVYLAANKMDEDNALKPLQDQLQACGILTNDRLVRRATITKHVDRNRPRVEAVIYESTLKPL